MNKLKIILISSLTTLVIVSLIFAYFYYRGENPVNFSKTNSSQQVNVKPAVNKIDIAQNDSTKNAESNTSISSSRQTVLTRTVAKVSPAVVGITVTEIQEYRNPWSFDPYLDQFLRQFYGGDRIIRKEIKGLGSGTIISPDGYILTNDHVAGNAVKIIVTLTDGRHFDAKKIGTDMSSDICLLKIDAQNLPFLKFGDSDKILIGEWVIALGNPFGLFEINERPTVTVGVISAVGMNLGVENNRYYYNMLQTDAAINSGNSGGPLVNSIGEIIGMNTLIFSQSGGNIGLGFAIPANKIKDVIKDLKEFGKVDRDFWTGLSIQTINEGIAKYFNLSNTEGVIVTDVVANSPADKAGIQVADIITEMNGDKINDDETMINMLHTFKSGDILSLKIIRKGKVIFKNLKLEKRK